MTTTLSEERLAEIQGYAREFDRWDGDDGEFVSCAFELLAEVERLRQLQEAVTTMPPDTRYEPRVAARLLWHWEQTFRRDNHLQMAEWLAGVREALEADDSD